MAAPGKPKTQPARVLCDAPCPPVQRQETKKAKETWRAQKPSGTLAGLGKQHACDLSCLSGSLVVPSRTQVGRNWDPKGNGF